MGQCSRPTCLLLLSRVEVGGLTAQHHSTATASPVTPQSLENDNDKDDNEDLALYGGLFDNEQKRRFWRLKRNSKSLSKYCSVEDSKSGKGNSAICEAISLIFEMMVEGVEETTEGDEERLSRVNMDMVRRLKDFGVTQGELTRYLDALLKDSEHLATIIDNVSSVDNLDFIMETDALGHKVMDKRQGHESLLAVAGAVTLEEVNFVGAKVLEFIAEFAKPTTPLPAAIVACVPKKVHIEGAGETRFKISSIEITDAIKAGLDEPIQPEPEIFLPST
ncbi:Stromal processing peptidase, chloroplastic [Glycine soja]